MCRLSDRGGGEFVGFSLFTLTGLLAGLLAKATKLSPGGFALIAARVVSLGCGFLITGIASRYFSRDEFGLWALVTPLLIIVLNFDLGIANALRNRLAMETQAEAREDFFTAAFFLCAVAVVLIGILVAVYAVSGFAFLFKTTDPVIRQTGGWLFLFSAAIMLLRLPFYLGINSFFSYREAQYNALFDAGTWASLAAVAFAMRLFRLALEPAAVAYQFTAIAVSALGFAYFLYRRRWSLHWPADWLARLRRMLAKALPFGFLQFVVVISSYSAMFVVGAVVNVAAAGPYRAATALFLSIVSVQLAYLMPVWSEFSFAISERNYAGLSGILKNALLQTSVFFVPVFVIIAFGPIILRLWLGIPFDDWILLLILAGSAIGSMLTNTLSLLFNGVGRPQYTTYCVVISAAILLPCCIFFGQQYGVRGVAAATLVASVANVVAMGVLVLRLLKIYRAQQTAS